MRLGVLRKKTAVTSGLGEILLYKRSKNITKRIKQKAIFRKPSAFVRILPFFVKHF